MDGWVEKRREGGTVGREKSGRRETMRPPGLALLCVSGKSQISFCISFFFFVLCYWNSISLPRLHINMLESKIWRFSVCYRSPSTLFYTLSEALLITLPVNLPWSQCSICSALTKVHIWDTNPTGQPPPLNHPGHCPVLSHPCQHSAPSSFCQQHIWWKCSGISPTGLWICISQVAHNTELSFLRIFAIHPSSVVKYFGKSC